MYFKLLKFNKVEAEVKKDEAFSGLAVNLDISEIKKMGSDIRFEFIYSVDYEPSVAKIIFKGFGIISGSTDEVTKMLSGWQKDKSVEPIIAEMIVNTINFNAETNGVLVAKALGIVSPLMSPKMQIKN